MKKVVSAVMAVALCSSFVCSNLADTGFNFINAEEYNNAVDLFMANYDVWSETALLPTDIRNVGFLDIDFDGELELITKSLEGSGGFTYLKFYKVSDNKIIEMNIKDLYDFPGFWQRFKIILQ